MSDLFVHLFIIVNAILSLGLACGLTTCYDHESFLPSSVVESADEVINGVNEPLFFLDADRTLSDNSTFVNVRQIGDTPPFTMPYLKRSPPSPGICLQEYGPANMRHMKHENPRNDCGNSDGGQLALVRQVKTVIPTGSL
jgi:hypothetical protein